MSGLPAFLTQDSGVNSGLMIPQVTAAALVSENKSLAFPASVDSIPTSAGQEDHVSMAPIAARKAAQIARNAAGVIAVELMAAAEGIDYHAPLNTSPGLQVVHAKIRELSPSFYRRSLLGRRDERAPERGPVGQFRRRRGWALARRASSAVPCTGDQGRRSPLDVGAKLPHGRRTRHVALGLKGAALVDALACRAKVAQNPGPGVVPRSRLLAVAQLTVPQKASPQRVTLTMRVVRVRPMSFERGLRRSGRGAGHRGKDKCCAFDHAFHACWLARFCGKNGSLSLPVDERKARVLGNGPSKEQRACLPPRPGRVRISGNRGSWG